MANPNSAQVQQDFEADFNSRRRAIVKQWNSGELPFNDAIMALGQLRDEAVARHDLSGQGSVESALGYVQGYRGNLTASIHHFERARALFTQAEDWNQVASCDLNIGESYRYKGDFKRARALFDKAYESSKELRDSENEALSISNRGQMMLSMGHLDEAQADLNEACRLASDLPENALNRNSILCETFHGLAVLHVLYGELEAAWQEAKKALTLSSETNQPLEIGFANRAAGEVLTALEAPIDLHYPSDPDVYYQIANEAFREINAEGEVARTMYSHARSLARRGRRMTAARKLQLAMVIFSRLGMVDDAAKAAETQREVL